MITLKRVFALLLAFMLLAANAQAAMLLEYDGEQHNYTGAVYKLYVNGKAVSTPLAPIIFNDRALVPVREVFEAMGASVDYAPSSREITVSMTGKTVLLQINSQYAYVNGERKTLTDGVVPKLIAKAGESAKTMIPVRFASENLGMVVNFDAANGAIRISDPSVYTEPVAPAPSTPSATVNSVNTSYSSDGVVITVGLSARAERFGELVMLDSGVLYCDIYGADYSVSNKTVDAGAVKAIRFGQHDGYARVAIDTAGATGYYKKVSSDMKTLTITVSGDGSAATPPPAPTPTPAPTVTPAATPTPEAHLTGEKIVVIDAGHGGTDPGASSTHDGVKYVEKNLNLTVAKKVRDILTANGVRVEMTRSGDTYPTLWERSALANKLGASMFVSIHSNAIENRADVNGIMVFYSNTNNGTRYGLTSKKLATDIYKNMISYTNADERGVKTEQHVVTRTSEMPAVLVEMGFLTNAVEAANMANGGYQDKLASAIADAILADLPSVKIPPDAN